ncbi:MAG: hypothetical protein ABH842_03250 [Candidatus Micrarchaeota archaeon]
MNLSKLDIALILLLFLSNAILITLVLSFQGDITKQQTSFDAEKSHLMNTITLLNSTILVQSDQIDDLGDQIMEKNQELENTHNLLLSTQIELNTTKQELANKSLSLEEAQEGFETLKLEVENIEQTINESMEWFSANSNMPPSLDYFVSYIEKKCMDDGLNLACIEFFMKKNLKFSYKNENPDKLYPLDELVSRGGGDCEDYSLFLKAILNDIKENNPDTDVIGWESGNGEFIVYEGDGRIWYYDHAEEVNFGSLKDLNPVVICYTTSYTTNQLLGHCVVGLSEQKIETSRDISELSGASLFEPQDGEYLGEVGVEFSLCEGEDCSKNTNDIIILITDNDFYKMQDGKWQSFGLALVKLNKFKKDLE